MNSNLFKTLILLLALILSSYLTCGQKKSTSNDTICVKYVFWSMPKYSHNCNSKYNKTNNLIGLVKSDFKSLFQNDTEEYKYLKKAERQLIIGNFAFAVPAGAMLGLALAGNFNKDTKTALIIGGSTLCLFDITIGISSFKNLKRAVQLRNSRIQNID